VRRSVLSALVLVLALTAAPRRAAAEDPSNGRLVLAGAGMAVPTYFLGVMWHEGTHALAAKAFGAEILELKLLPGFKDGYFYFGYTSWRGHLSCREKVFTLLAPKLTDLLLLGGFAAVALTDSFPANDYASLALTVLATGAWVDFSKDIFSFKPVNDVMKVHSFYGRKRELQRLPWRLLHLSISLGAAYVVYLGYRDVFADETGAAPAPIFVPLLVGTL
jgi:hypothetical protein